jgi:hypothetical protein
MKTSEQRYSELVDALESIEDAEQAGKILGRDATARLWQRRTDAINPIRIAEGRYRQG